MSQPPFSPRNTEGQPGGSYRFDRPSSPREYTIIPERQIGNKDCGQTCLRMLGYTDARKRFPDTELCMNDLTLISGVKMIRFGPLPLLEEPDFQQYAHMVLFKPKRSVDSPLHWVVRFGDKIYCPTIGERNAVDYEEKYIDQIAVMYAVPFNGQKIPQEYYDRFAEPQFSQDQESEYDHMDEELRALSTRVESFDTTGDPFDPRVDILPEDIEWMKVVLMARLEEGRRADEQVKRGIDPTTLPHQANPAAQLGLSYRSDRTHDLMRPQSFPPSLAQAQSQLQAYQQQGLSSGGADARAWSAFTYLARDIVGALPEDQNPLFSQKQLPEPSAPEGKTIDATTGEEVSSENQVTKHSERKDTNQQSWQVITADKIVGHMKNNIKSNRWDIWGTLIDNLDVADALLTPEMNAALDIAVGAKTTPQSTDADPRALIRIGTSDLSLPLGRQPLSNLEKILNHLRSLGKDHSVGFLRTLSQTKKRFPDQATSYAFTLTEEQWQEQVSWIQNPQTGDDWDGFMLRGQYLKELYPDRFARDIHIDANAWKEMKKRLAYYRSVGKIDSFWRNAHALNTLSK